MDSDYLHWQTQAGHMLLAPVGTNKYAEIGILKGLRVTLDSSICQNLDC